MSDESVKGLLSRVCDVIDTNGGRTINVLRLKGLPASRNGELAIIQYSIPRLEREALENTPDARDLFPLSVTLKAGERGIVVEPNTSYRDVPQYSEIEEQEIARLIAEIDHMMESIVKTAKV